MAGAEDFDYDLAFAELLAAGASPAQAKAAIANPAMRPSPMQPPDATGVRAGQRGLPPMPEVVPNALAGGTRLPRQIQERAMRGMAPTPDQASFLAAIAPEKEARSNALGGAGLELTGVPQAVRAGEAVGEALADPTIPNLGNAGFQTGMALFRPGKAFVAAGAGLGAAAAKDLGMFDTEAQAQRAPKQASKVPELPGLNPEQNAEYNTLTQTLKRDGWMPPAQIQRMKELSAVSNKFVDENAASERRMKEEEARRFGEAEAARLADERAAEAKRKEDERLAYNTAVTRAETSRDEILNRAKSKRFEEGDTGKLYNKLGMGTPALMAGAAGLATRAFGAGGYIAPMATGSVAGLAGAHWPLGHEVMFAPVTNPEKDAYQAYARELPPTHPRKEELSTYAENLPTLNPAREEAVKEFYDPWKFAERSAIGGILEGPISGLLGAELANAPKRIVQGVAAAPGEALASYRGSMAKADIAQARRELAANRLSGVRAEGRLRDEASALERNALAGEPGAVSAMPAADPASSVASVQPNVLATGNLTALSARTPQSAVSVPGQPLAPGALSNQQPSEILGSIKPVQRDVPTSFPQSTPPANPTLPKSSRPPDMPEWASEPPQGIKLKPGQWWDANMGQPREGGKYAPMPKYKASRPKPDNPTE